ncbi:hypothetical protein BH10ACI4_BH10ACI4_10220 [soil metagenome]
MTMKRVLWAAALLLTSTTGRMYGAAVPVEMGDWYGWAADDSPYAEGTKAMNEQRWQDAITAFDKVIAAKGKRVEASLYWKAYSLRKLGDLPAAQATCELLRGQFKGSPWNRDCATLTLDTKMSRQGSGGMIDPIAVQPIDPVGSRRVPPLPSQRIGVEAREGWPDGDGRRNPDDDLKLLAMNSLLNQDPAKAIPMLRGMLSGNQSSSIKKHALFVLSQSKTPEAEAVMREAVLGKLGPEVQAQAIQSVGVFLGKKDNATLVEVYRGSSDPKIKRAVVSALFISQDAPRLVELAKNEKDLDLKRRIVSQLAMMKDPAATDYMMELLK